MPRNSKKYSVPHVTTTAPTVSHVTQSDDEGNVIVELDVRNEDVRSGVPEIPEVESDANPDSHTTLQPDSSGELTGLAPVAGDETGSDAAHNEKQSPEITAAIQLESNAPPVVAAPAAAANPTTTSTVAEDVNVDSTPPKSGFFRSICRCFKNMCSLMCFSCCCCCRRRRRGSTEP